MPDQRTERCQASEHASCSTILEINSLNVSWCPCPCHNPQVIAEQRRRIADAQLFQRGVYVQLAPATNPAQPSSAPSEVDTAAPGELG